jgi:osmotically-inducible protein OsmY
LGLARPRGDDIALGDFPIGIWAKKPGWLPAQTAIAAPFCRRRFGWGGAVCARFREKGWSMKMCSKIVRLMCLAIFAGAAAAISADNVSEGGASLRAAEMLGMDLLNPGGEKVGIVKNLLVDLSSGRVGAVLVSPVAVADVATHPVNVSPGHFSLSGDSKHLVMNAGKEALKPNSAAAAPEEPAGLKATDLIGMTVANDQSDKLGEVRDFVMELHSGRIVYFGLSAGGILGIGDKLIALPPRALSMSADQKSLRVSADRELLKRAPALQKGQWPTLADKNFLASVNGFQPLTAGGGPEIREAAGAKQKSPQVTTPKSNERISSQGNVVHDRRDSDLAQRVTDALTADNSLAAAVQQISVTSENGLITLRGYANSEAEKRAVVSKIEAISGVGKVNDQLEVTRSR